MAIDHPQVPVCCLSNGYMLDSFPFICFRKFIAVYQCVTSSKCIFFESDMYFPVVSWDIREKCSNFALESQVMRVGVIGSKSVVIPFQIRCKSVPDPIPEKGT